MPDRHFLRGTAVQPALQTRINGTFMSFDIKNAMMWQKMSPFPWTLQMKMVAYLFFVLLGSVPAFAQTGSKASSPMNPEESRK